MKVHPFIETMQHEFQQVVAGKPAQKDADCDSILSIRPNEKLLGVISNPRIIELRKLDYRCYHFFRDYRDAHGFGDLAAAARMRGSDALDHLDISTQLARLREAITAWHWMLVQIDFPVHYHDSYALGVRQGFKLVRIPSLDKFKITAKPVMANINHLPSLMEGVALRISIEAWE